MNALIIASSSGNIEVVELLLSHNSIDVNITDNNCDTALMYAIRNGHIAVIRLLLSHNDIVTIYLFSMV
jgi:ankyrin repeat protein